MSLVESRIFGHIHQFDIFLFESDIQREEEKAKRSLKDAAKKNDKDSCVVLAKEIVGARKTINKIQISKTQLNSIQMQMKNQLCKLQTVD